MIYSITTNLPRELDIHIFQRRPYGYRSNTEFINHLLNVGEYEEFVEKLVLEINYRGYKIWGRNLWMACYFKAAYFPYNPPKRDLLNEKLGPLEYRPEWDEV